MPLEAAVLSAIIGGAASLASAGTSAASAALANRNQYKWTKEMFNYQNEYNQQHYNPAANMELLRQAGINPHEVAGTPGSGMSMQGSISTPQYQSPLAGSAQAMQQAVGMALQAYQTKKSLQNQTDLVQSQVAKNNAEAAKTNFQVDNLLPVELEYQKNRVKIPLYQIGMLKLQQQQALNEISLFSMQKQKYQLALDLMELEKQYAGEYYKWRNESVKYDSQIKKSESGIRGLDLQNYQDFGLRPQDPYYTRIGANIVHNLEGNDTWLGRKLRKWLGQ